METAVAAQEQLIEVEVVPAAEPSGSLPPRRRRFAPTTEIGSC
jgi:hypothetical protein